MCIRDSNNKEKEVVICGYTGTNEIVNIPETIAVEKVVGEMCIRDRSTLLKTLLGLIKPLLGKITINLDKSKKGIGYLPQQTVAQKDFPASVMEVVLSGFLNSGHKSPFYSKKEKAEALSNICLLYTSRCV